MSCSRCNGSGLVTTAGPDDNGMYDADDCPDCSAPVRNAVAALYVEKDGAYYGLDGVDPWDQERDARLYDGPYPVVAHPPCNKWSPLAYINQKRIPGYRVGDDGGCFEAALAAVDRWGGVLEHPANSVAWRTFKLRRPVRGRWLEAAGGGWITEVDQGRYGHRARKRTWLYVSGVGAEYRMRPLPLDWEPAVSDAIVSGFTHQKKGEHVACEHRRVRPKEASRTPDAFRDLLLELARTSAVVGGRMNAADVFGEALHPHKEQTNPVRHPHPAHSVLPHVHRDCTLEPVAGDAGGPSLSVPGRLAAALRCVLSASARVGRLASPLGRLAGAAVAVCGRVAVHGVDVVARGWVGGAVGVVGS